MSDLAKTPVSVVETAHQPEVQAARAANPAASSATSSGTVAPVIRGIKSPLGRGAYRIKRVLRQWLRPPSRKPDGWKPAGGNVMVIAPHPDDEIVGCGGTLRRHVLAGDTVIAVYLTRGGGSLGYPWLSAEEKEQVREAEARASSQVLGIGHVTFLNGPDGHLSEAIADMRPKLLGVLREHQPRLIYVPHARDSHVDHVAAYRLLRAALAEANLPRPSDVLQYEVWSPLAAELAVDVTPYMKRKMKALRRHRLALDAFDYFATMLALARYRCGTMLQHNGYAEAFRRSAD